MLLMAGRVRIALLHHRHQRQQRVFQRFLEFFRMLRPCLQSGGALPAQIAGIEHADQLAACIHHRQVADAMLGHQARRAPRGCPNPAP